MDTAMTNPAARVCPRCGEEAGEQRFCESCGLNLLEQPELPTRSAWEASQVADEAGLAAGGAAHRAAEQAFASRSTDTMRPPALPLWHALRNWFSARSTASKVACLAVPLVVLLLLVAVLIGATTKAESVPRAGETGSFSLGGSPTGLNPYSARGLASAVLTDANETYAKDEVSYRDSQVSCVSTHPSRREFICTTRETNGGTYVAINRVRDDGSWYRVEKLSSSEGEG